MRKILSLLAGALMLMSFSPVDTFPEEWTLYTSQDGVEIYYMLSDCDDVQNGLYQKKVLIKVVNTLDLDVHVYFAYRKWFDGVANFEEGSISDEQWRLMDIPANSSIGGDCATWELALYQSFKDKEEVAKLTKFELVEINVEVK